jgi:TolB-like protein
VPLARRSPATPESLSPRRREILALLARGLSNQQLAAQFGISEGTVRAHVSALLSSLGLANRTEAAAAWHQWRASPAEVAQVLARPAIAVLPLQALGGDPSLPPIAEGLTGDLTNLLSRWCWFPVIATSSLGGARALGPTAREIGPKLGARFLVDGSLRAAGGTLRLSLRIDDAEDGRTLWSEQCDFAADRLFEVQDALTAAMVAAAYPVLIQEAVGGEVRRPQGHDLAAWERAHQGMALQAARDRESNEAAALLFQQALVREPRLVLAWFGLGLAAYDSVLNQWGDKAAALQSLARCAEKCLDIAPHGGEGWYLLARSQQAHGEWARSILPLETAIAKNPSFALAHAMLAQALLVSGRADEGAERMQHAVRLSPRAFVASLATLHFIRHKYAEALEASERALVTNLSYPFCRALAVASAHWAGDEAAARRHLAQLRAQHPEFNAASFLGTFGAHDAVERISKALGALTSGG